MSALELGVFGWLEEQERALDRLVCEADGALLQLSAALLGLGLPALHTQTYTSSSAASPSPALVASTAIECADLDEDEREQLRLLELARSRVAALAELLALVLHKTLTILECNAKLEVAYSCLLVGNFGLSN